MFVSRIVKAGSDLAVCVANLLDCYTLGAIFNYYGRRSICKMYAENYEDDADMSVISSLIKEQTVTALNSFMLNWMNPGQVAIVDALYYRMAISIAQQYHLT